VYYRLKQVEEALSDYDKAISLDPQYTSAYENRSRLFSDLGLTDEALTDIDQAISLEPAQALHYVSRGLIYYYQKILIKALLDYNLATNLQPQYAPAHFGCGIAYTKLGYYKEALESFNRGMEFDHSRGYYFRGQLLFELKDYDGAKSDFEKSLNLESDSVFVEAALAITHYALGEVEEAYSLWHELVEKDDKHMDADRVGAEYIWTDPLIEEARKLIASLEYN
jgi:tetratricopeptide (TPR) repeat protein